MEKTKAKPAAIKGKKRDLDTELIKERAYQIYLERTQKDLPGDAREDWLKAEAELS